MDVDGALRRLGEDPVADEAIRRRSGFSCQGDIWLYFPTAEEIAAVFAPEFQRERLLVPSYRLGERFPTVIFSRR